MSAEAWVDRYNRAFAAAACVEESLLKENIERIALRMLEKDLPEIIWEDAAPQLQEKYRQRAREFVATVRHLHTRDPEAT